MALLERGDFLDTLAEYAREAREGSGRLVFVVGESGIGKTALLEAFESDTGDSRFLWGACDGMLTPRPLGPLFDIASRTGTELAELCRSDANREELFAAFLAEVDRPGPLTVAVIEDVHWADASTLDLLRFVGRRLSRVAGLVVASFRDDALAADEPLRLVLGDLATQRSTRREQRLRRSCSGGRPLRGPPPAQVGPRRSRSASETRAVLPMQQPGLLA